MILPEKAILKKFKTGNIEISPDKGILTILYLANGGAHFHFNNGNGIQKIITYDTVFNYLLDNGDFINKVYSKEVVIVQYNDIYIIPIDSIAYKTLTEKTIIKKELKPGWECVLQLRNTKRNFQFYGEFSLIVPKFNTSGNYYCLIYKEFVFRDKDNGEFIMFDAKKDFIVTDIISEIGLFVEDEKLLETAIAAENSIRLNRNDYLLLSKNFKDYSPKVKGGHYVLSKEEYLELIHLRDQQKENVKKFKENKRLINEN